MADPAIAQVQLEFFVKWQRLLHLEQDRAMSKRAVVICVYVCVCVCVYGVFGSTRWGRRYGRCRRRRGRGGGGVFQSGTVVIDRLFVAVLAALTSDVKMLEQHGLSFFLSKPQLSAACFCSLLQG